LQINIHVNQLIAVADNLQYKKDINNNKIDNNKIDNNNKIDQLKIQIFYMRDKIRLIFNSND